MKLKLTNHFLTATVLTGLLFISGCETLNEKESEETAVKKGYFQLPEEYRRNQAAKTISKSELIIDDVVRPLNSNEPLKKDNLSKIAEIEKNNSLSSSRISLRSKPKKPFYSQFLSGGKDLKKFRFVLTLRQSLI